MTSSSTGQLIVISGPSGVGKSTVVDCLLKSCELPLELSISATTRPAREGENDGVDYWFLSTEEFQERRRRGEFLECAEVFSGGEWYGTLEQPVTDKLNQGKDVILEIDVTGALLVLKRFPAAITIFIHPGDLKTLEARLRGRGTESEDAIKRRMSVAESELEMAPQYSHVINNNNIQSPADQICKLLTKLKQGQSYVR